MCGNDCLIVDILAGSERGALIAREMVTHRGAELEIERLFLYRVADGLLRECWLYDQDQRLIDDILNGRLIALIGVAIVRPAEFVILRFEQITNFGAAQ